ncbi:MAG: hypothetical protein GWN31_07480 [Candidatus Thorarchaeota archaeon]|nr:hypothetical protein [Candidatus Thorarchaeota archaeon]
MSFRFETKIFQGRNTESTKEPCKGCLSTRFPSGKATRINGGYHATRFAILEHLAERRKKATALVVQVITPAYIVCPCRILADPRDRAASFKE